jgi:hypothetical protein
VRQTQPPADRTRELPPEILERVREAAKARGLSVAEQVQAWLDGAPDLPRVGERGPHAPGPTNNRPNAIPSAAAMRVLLARVNP